MSSSHSTFFICLPTCALFLQTTFGASPLLHFCLSSAGNFTSSSSYKSNLINALSNLNSQTPPQGFGLNSVGSSPNQVYGLSFCHGDINASDCKTCVNEASNESRQLCPYKKCTIIWYDNCLLKYLNTDFFYKIDTNEFLFMSSSQNANNPATFNNQTRELLSQLATKATLTPKLYAVGISNKIYGLVQCTRDLSSNDCFKCLDALIGQLPNCCNGQVGGRVYTSSCIMRYEIYPFFSF